MNFQVVEFIRDFGAASGELVIQADRKIGPRFGLGIYLLHAAYDVCAPSHDAIFVVVKIWSPYFDTLISKS